MLTAIVITKSGQVMRNNASHTYLFFSKLNICDYQHKMYRVDITPKNRVIPSAFAGCTAQLAASDQAHKHVEDFLAIAVGSAPNPHHIYSGNHECDVLSTVHRGSYPYRGILSQLISYGVEKPSYDWLFWWETFDAFVSPVIMNLIQTRATDAKKRWIDKHEKEPDREFSPSDFNLRAVILSDNTNNCVDALLKTCKKLTCKAGIQIECDWMATYTTAVDTFKTKHSLRWMRGVDGDTINTANSRAWRNRIATTIKRVQLVAVNSLTEFDACGGIIFALTTLTAKGAAIITLPVISTSALITLVHLFSQCFSTSHFVYSITSDCMMLVGEDFLANISKEHQRILNTFLDSIVDDMRRSIFSSKYLNEEHFVATEVALSKFVDGVWKIRREYISTLYTVTDRVKTRPLSMFVDLVPEIIKSEFPDNSATWITRTGLNMLPRM